jgi:hypothetical protein
LFILPKVYQNEIDGWHGSDATFCNHSNRSNRISELDYRLFGWLLASPSAASGAGDSVVGLNRLTKDNFVMLYDGCAEVLHCRNPYAPGDPTINVHFTVEEWLRRIKLFLSLHFVQLVDTPGLWVIQVPNECVSVRVCAK